MKTIKNIIPLVLAIACFAGCEYEDLQTFKESPDAYFLAHRDYEEENDSINIAFFYLPVEQVTKELTIRVTGPLSDKDRHVSVRAAESSTAVAGTHYNMPATVLIPAGKETGTLTVEVMRSPDLTDELLLLLEIVPNQDFGARVASVLTSDMKESIQITSYTIRISNNVIKPSLWMDGYFGAFSPKKLFLICDLNYVTPARLDGALDEDGNMISPGSFFIFARFTRFYLEEQRQAGNTIMEEDGVTPMTMGSYS